MIPKSVLTEIMITNRNIASPHPAYTDSEPAGYKWRASFQSGVLVHSDPQHRVPFHRWALDIAREKGKIFLVAGMKYKD